MTFQTLYLFIDYKIFSILIEIVLYFVGSMLIISFLTSTKKWYVFTYRKIATILVLLSTSCSDALELRNCRNDSLYETDALAYPPACNTTKQSTTMIKTFFYKCYFTTYILQEATSWCFIEHNTTNKKKEKQFIMQEDSDKRPPLSLTICVAKCQILEEVHHLTLFTWEEGKKCPRWLRTFTMFLIII